MIWKDIKGYEGIYQVSDNGLIKSLEREIRRGGFISKISCYQMKPRVRNAGYYRIGLSLNNVIKYYSVHRLVAMAFIENTDNKPCVNHINGIKTDNRAENLEWVTQKENIRHAKDVLCKNIGDASFLVFYKAFEHHGSKFNKESLDKLFEMRKKGTSFGNLAKCFKVDKSTIQAIFKGKTYSSVTGIVRKK